MRGTKKVGKISVAFIFFLVFWTLIFSGLFLFLVPEFTRDPGSRTIFVREYDENFFKVMFGDLFKEPFERLVIFFKKGKGAPIGITTHNSNRIDIDPSELRHLLVKRSRKIKDITFTVHNHLTPRRPSEDNHKMHHALRRLGFKGPSFVYYPHSGELLPIE